MLVIDSNVLIFIKKEKKNMKILKLMAIVALVGCGSSILAMNEADKAHAADLLKRAQAAYKKEQRQQLKAQIEAEKDAILAEYMKVKAPTAEGRSTPEQKLLKQRWSDRNDALDEALFAFPLTIN
jgi:hypothetical protein